MNDIQLIDAEPRHMEAVLELNEQFVEFLSPLDNRSLAELVKMSGYARVFELNGEVVAFLIAFFPGADYDSPNYRWFNEQAADFAYRPNRSFRKGARPFAWDKFYDDLVQCARSGGFKRLVCEYNVKPMNKGSAVFHQRYGFEEVGQQELAGGKIVSLQAYALS